MSMGTKSDDHRRVGGQGKMKKGTWYRYGIVRAMLAVGTLAGMVLASGAGTHWH